MGLGQGIQNAGSLFSQAILAKHEEKLQLERQAKERALEQARIDNQSRQIDVQEANRAYDLAWRDVSLAPEGSTMSSETAGALPPRIRDIYTRPQMELPSRQYGPSAQPGLNLKDLGQSTGQQPTGRHVITSPYRKEEKVAEIRAGQAADTEAERTRRAIEVAKIRQSLSEYQKLSARLRGESNATARAALAESIRYHKDIISQREYDNLLDNQTRYDLGIIRETADDPTFVPPTTRPTGRTKPGANPGAFNPAAIDWSKLF